MSQIFASPRNLAHDFSMEVSSQESYESDYAQIEHCEPPLTEEGDAEWEQIWKDDKDVMWSNIWRMGQTNRVEIQRVPSVDLDLDECDCEYVWNGIYHPDFPEEWSESHVDGTGPEMCGNCAEYGCVDKLTLSDGTELENVFLGYCVNCAIFCYDGSRGRGFTNKGQELSDEDILAMVPSSFNTYLLQHKRFFNFE